MATAIILCGASRQEIIGAPAAADELLTAALTVLRRAESELFLEHIDFQWLDFESTRRDLHELFRSGYSSLIKPELSESSVVIQSVLLPNALTMHVE